MKCTREGPCPLFGIHSGGMPSPRLQGWIDQPLVKCQPSLEAWLRGQEWAAGRKSGRRRSGKKGCRGSVRKGKASVAMEGAARYSGMSIRISEGHGQDRDGDGSQGHSSILSAFPESQTVSSHPSAVGWPPHPHPRPLHYPFPVPLVCLL